MSAYALRILDQTSLVSGDTMASTAALDLLEFRELDVVVRVHQAAEGEAPALIIEHATANEDDAWLSFSDPIRVDLTTSPVVTLDIVART